MTDKPKFRGGVVGLRSLCTNQQEVEVASASGKIMVAAREAAKSA